jgi:hypothetical protein
MGKAKGEVITYRDVYYQTEGCPVVRLPVFPGFLKRRWRGRGKKASLAHKLEGS